MGALNKDISIALLLMSGLWLFLSAQFELSTLLFGSAALFSNMGAQSNVKS